jgi:hypothetical protein
MMVNSSQADTPASNTLARRRRITAPMVVTTTTITPNPMMSPDRLAWRVWLARKVASSMSHTATRAAAALAAITIRSTGCSPTMTVKAGDCDTKGQRDKGIWSPATALRQADPGVRCHTCTSSSQAAGTWTTYTPGLACPSSWMRPTMRMSAGTRQRADGGSGSPSSPAHSASASIAWLAGTSRAASSA